LILLMVGTEKKSTNVALPLVALRSYQV